MAINYLEMTAKTEEEAIQKALAQLGLERDDVSVEILERAKKGIFGIGASPARIRVTYGLEEAAAVSAVAPVKKPEPVRASAAPKKESPATKPVSPAPESAKPPRPVRPAAEASHEKTRVQKTEPKETPATLPNEVCTDDTAAEITAFLSGLLEHMNSVAEVKVYRDEEGRYRVVLLGEKLGQLIGRRGETLDAIQQLTNYAVNRNSEKRVRVFVDAENYRLKREQSLENLAQRVAAKVLKYHRNVTLEPMNAYERHVIHTVLQDVEGITTYSMGTEPNRRVIVALEKK